MKMIFQTVKYNNTLNLEIILIIIYMFRYINKTLNYSILYYTILIIFNV